MAADLVADWHSSLGALVDLGDPETVHTTTIRTATTVPHCSAVACFRRGGTFAAHKLMRAPGQTRLEPTTTTELWVRPDPRYPRRRFTLAVPEAVG